MPGSTWEHFSTDKRRGDSVLPARLAEGAGLATSLFASLARRRPRLVHVLLGGDRGGWAFREATVYLALARRAGARTIAHLQTADLGDLGLLRPSRRPLVRGVWESADLVVALSPDQAERAAESGVPGDRIFVVPNGVPLPDLDLPEARIATPKDPLRLLFLGSIEERKGVDVLIEAVARARRARGPVLVMDAVGPYYAGSRQIEQWRAAGGPVGVTFRGPAPARDIPALLRACDGLVLPSRAEGLPFAILEGMAATRPVIAAATGAVRGVLDGGAGVTVPPGDPAALAEALIRFIDDPETRLDLAAAGWHRVRRTYTLKHSMDGTFAAYRRVMGLGDGCDLAAAIA